MRVGPIIGLVAAAAGFGLVAVHFFSPRPSVTGYLLYPRQLICERHAAVAASPHHRARPLTTAHAILPPGLGQRLDPLLLGQPIPASH
jgi:hypothetical protein